MTRTVLARCAPAAVAMVAATLTGCDPLPPTAETMPPAPATAQPAAAMVDQLEVKGRSPKTGYNRNLFGPTWTDTDRNGCDTRNDILARDLTNEVVAPDCKIMSGALHDPYSGQSIRFVRGDGQIDIDHIVPLSDAWQKGAQTWDTPTRTAFANDPANLQATSSTLNRQKGDSDAATWLPPNRDHWCAYGTRQAAVKHAYGLWVTPAEKDALRRLVNTCEGK